MNVVFSEAIRRYGAPYVGNLCGAIIAGLSPYYAIAQIAKINSFLFQSQQEFPDQARLFLNFSDTSRRRYQSAFFLPMPRTDVNDWADIAIAFVYLLAGVEPTYRELLSMSAGWLFRMPEKRNTVSFEPRWYVNGSTWDKGLPLKLAIAMIEEAKRDGIPVVANISGFPIIATGLDSPTYIREVIEQTLRANAGTQPEKSEFAYQKLSGGLKKNADGTYSPGAFDDIYKFANDLATEAQSSVSAIVGKFNGVKIEADVWDALLDVVERYFSLTDTPGPLDNVQDSSTSSPESLCPYTAKGRRMEI